MHVKQNHGGPASKRVKAQLNKDAMSDAEADQIIPNYRPLRRCSSAICLSEKHPIITPLEHRDVMRVRQLSHLEGPRKPCLKPNDATGSSLNSLNRRVRGFIPIFSETELPDDFDTCSVRSDDVFTTEPVKGKNSRELRGSIVLITSGLYGIILVVIGLVVPIAETFVHPFRPYPFEAFYIYIYALSIGFIIYIYLFLLHDSPFAVEKLKRTISERSSFRKKTFNSGNIDTESCISESCSLSPTRKRKITFDNEKAQSAASFYLRLGAVAFGIGCMILEGLYIGQFLEMVNATDGPCRDFVMMIRPILKPCFTFSQLLFIFRNSKIVIYKNRPVAKFGFMHMAATNICAWFRIIVMETLQTLHESQHEQAERSHGLDHTTSERKNTTSLGYILHSIVHHTSSSHDHVTTTEDPLQVYSLPEFSCRYSNMIGGMLMNFSHFLYPFCIEYSVICAGILYVMWKNVGLKNRVMFEDLEQKCKQSHRMSVDCSGSSRGLFVGIFLFVGMVCSMIVFYVISEHDLEAQSTAVIVHTTEIIILTLAIGANVVGGLRMRNLRFTMETDDLLEETLILVSMTGLYMFSVFNLIAAFFYVGTIKGILTIVVYILMIILATTQTMFLIFGMRLSARMVQHVKTKPGREFVTFLMLCNISLWGITTFEIQKPAHNPQQVEMYGVTAWTIFTHISVPLGIFYFFHSTVCLSHIWKHAWKFKRVSKI